MAGAFIQLKLCGFVVDLPACLASNVHDFQAVSHIMGLGYLSILSLEFY